MRLGPLASVVVFSLVCSAAGDEPKKLDPVHRESADLDEADEDDRALLEQDRTNLDAEIEDLQAKLEDLEKEQRRAHQRGAKHELFVEQLIEGTERQLHQLQAEQKRRLAEPRPSDDLDEAGRSVEHMRIAAKHLKAAGMHDLAHDLLEKAEAMQREQTRGRGAKEMDDLRREVDKIESHHKELQRKFDELLRESERFEREMKEFRNWMSKE
jgi:peptidoglycan hydrolase CwlO-like protein